MAASEGSDGKGLIFGNENCRDIVAEFYAQELGHLGPPIHFLLSRGQILSPESPHPQYY